MVNNADPEALICYSTSKDFSHSGLPPEREDVESRVFHVQINEKHEEVEIHREPDRHQSGRSQLGQMNPSGDVPDLLPVSWSISFGYRTEDCRHFTQGD